MSRYTPQKSRCFSCGYIVAAPLYLNYPDGKRHYSCIPCEEKTKALRKSREVPRVDYTKLNALWRVTVGEEV